NPRKAIDFHELFVRLGDGLGRPFVLTCIGLTAVWAAGLGVQVATPVAAEAAAQTAAPEAARPRAVLDKYCVTCHNARLKTAGLMLDRLDTARIGDAAETWEKVARKLRTHEMPPPGIARPDAATYGSMTGWLENALDQASAAAPRPGRTPVHRLNRTE